MNTRKLASLGLTLALALGVAEANAAQPTTNPVTAGTAAPMAQTGTTKADTTKTSTTKAAPASTAKLGGAKVGTKTDAKVGVAKLNSGRSVATPVSASHGMARASHRPRLSLVRLKRMHRAHLVRVLARTHVAHAGKKLSGKHA